MNDRKIFNIFSNGLTEFFVFKLLHYSVWSHFDYRRTYLMISFIFHSLTKIKTFRNVQVNIFPNLNRRRFQNRKPRPPPKKNKNNISFLIFKLRSSVSKFKREKTLFYMPYVKYETATRILFYNVIIRGYRTCYLHLEICLQLFLYC